MRPAKSFAGRILFWMAVIGLFPVVALTVPGYFSSREAVIDSERAKLHDTLHSRSRSLQNWLSEVREDLLFVGRSNCALGLCDQSHGDRQAGGCPFVRAVMIHNPAIRSITVFDAAWRRVAATVDAPDCMEDERVSRLRDLVVRRDDFVMSPEYCFSTGNTLLAVASPIPGGGKATTGYALASLDLSRFLASSGGEEGQRREAGKFYILTGEGECILPPAGHGGLLGRGGLAPPSPAGEGEAPVGRYLDFRGVPVLGGSEQVPGTDWLLVAEVDEAVAFLWLGRLLTRVVVVAFLTLCLVLAVSLFLARKLSWPMHRLARAAEDISAGKEWNTAPPFGDKEPRMVSEAFNRMLRNLKESRRALVRSASLAAIGELNSRAVHEMRNPLSSIKMNLQGLGRKEPLGPAGLVMKEIALDQTVRLEHILGNLLNYSRPLDVTPCEVDFRRLAGEVKENLGGELTRRGLELHVVDGLGADPIRVDAELMNQALTNLVGNAAQWAPEGGVVVLSAERHREKDGWVVIRVEDSGPGVPAGREEEIFKPFFSTREGGTGLGLANVRKIVEYHGGTVSAGARPQGGAVLSVELPAGGAGP